MPLPSAGTTSRYLPAFTRLLLTSMLAVIVPVILLNLIIDPFAIYGIGLFPRTEASGYEERLQLISDFEPKPECLIIGSSRTLAFDPEVVEELTGLRTFNFSGVGARAETIYATLRIALDDYNSPLKAIIIGVDPECFHPIMPIQPEARYIDAYAKYFIYHRAGRATVLERIKRLLTLDMLDATISSIRNIFRKYTNTPKMTVSENGYTTWIQREADIADGTYNLQERLDQRVRKYPDRSIFFSDYTELSEVRMHYWQDIIDICRERGIKVYAFLPSVHPQLYDLFQAIGVDDLLGEISSYLETSLSGTDGVFKDYTSIESFGGSPDDFYDEIHMRPQNCERLFRNLLSGEEVESSDTSDL